MMERCAWCGSVGPLRPVADLFGRVHLACTPSCPMTVERALVYVDDIAGRVLSAYSRSGMAGAVKHVLTEAVLAGARFRDETAVWRWLGQHAGLKALGVTRR
jgi:hypothetical protein